MLTIQIPIAAVDLVLCYRQLFKYLQLINRFDVGLSRFVGIQSLPGRYSSLSRLP